MSDGALLVAGAVLCLAAAAVAVAAIVAARARARRRAPVPGPAPADPFRDVDADALRGDPRLLKPGDIAEVRGRSFSVRGSLRFSQGASGWAEHLLDDAEGGKVWLSVEEDPDLEIVLWRQVPSATVRPGEPAVDFDGRRYTRDEAGRASFTSVGSTGLAAAGLSEYQDYTAPDGALLSFERFGAPTATGQPPASPGADWSGWEVARGERLHRAELRIFARGD